ncbi:hypothetical protein DAPPUDRAFT_106981 [Daphnia pulex]|uniref:Uncharacterized protein n=1 Tax=Daphnia pulex TaxID=6669 RepID=E9GVK1_DAPPU|nr:hypothetical protein DAPPUDRAFT_106981 [Daphnia pulex]|eukprot:EFX76514.1 hypothetical protein DAPPUDRAFT_106981 [Daphnia pulex]
MLVVSGRIDSSSSPGHPVLPVPAGFDRNGEQDGQADADDQSGHYDQGQTGPHGGTAGTAARATLSGLADLDGAAQSARHVTFRLVQTLQQRLTKAEPLYTLGLTNCADDDDMLVLLNSFPDVERRSVFI